MPKCVSRMTQSTINKILWNFKKSLFSTIWCVQSNVAENYTATVTTLLLWQKHIEIHDKETFDNIKYLRVYIAFSFSFEKLGSGEKCKVVGEFLTQAWSSWTAPTEAYWYLSSNLSH